MSFWSGAAVLVTAPHGFTGSHICRQLLRAGATVRGLVKPGAVLDNLADIRDHLELVTGDIVDYESTVAACRGIRYVIHSAALVSVPEALASPPKAMMVNATGAYHVALAALKSGAHKLLHISTCYVYGNLPPDEYPTRETSIPRPTEVYAVSKLSGEKLVHAVAAQGLPVVITRAFSKYGPGQGPRFFVPNVIVQLLRGGEVKLGDPRPTRDYSYVEDVTRGYLLAVERGRPGEIYNLSSGHERPVGEVCDMIVRLCQGAGGRIIWNATQRPHEAMRQAGDSTKAREELGWQPDVRLEDGLRMTVDWWRDRVLAEAAPHG